MARDHVSTAFSRLWHGPGILHRRQRPVAPDVMWSGSLGESHPQAPADPGVTVSRHRALLTNQSVRADPGPVSEQSGLSFLQPFPPLREPLVGPQPSILLPCPAPQVGADAS